MNIPRILQVQIYTLGPRTHTPGLDVERRQGLVFILGFNNYHDNIQMRDNWYKSDLEKTRLDQAGVDESVVDAAVGAFILEAIAKHGHPTKVQKSFFKNQKIPSSEIAKKTT